jgi:hypothetical protein
MQFGFERLSEDQRYKLMLATVLPRPIAWVTSQDSNGLVNAAPFSFFNAFGTEPDGGDRRGPEFADTAQRYLPQYPRDRRVRRQSGSLPGC